MRTIIFCHSYCLARGGKRLSSLSLEALEKAAAAMKVYQASQLILPCMYPKLSGTERQSKLDLLQDYGIVERKVQVIKNLSDTFEEVERLVREIGKKPARIIIVAEKYHIKRPKALLNALLPECEIIPFEFSASRYERTEEPSLIKSVRTANEGLWALSHLLGYLLTPFFIRKLRQRLANNARGKESKR